MTPAERESLTEEQLSALWAEAEMKHGKPWSDVFIYPERLLALIAMARTSLVQRDLVSSLEINLSNATKVGVLQMKRIADLEEELQNQLTQAEYTTMLNWRDQQIASLQAELRGYRATTGSDSHTVIMPNALLADPTEPTTEETK
jgi:hypothetical protein